MPETARPKTIADRISGGRLPLPVASQSANPDAAMAIAMIVIGGNLSLTNLIKINGLQLSAVVLIKLVILPLITLVVLSLLKLNPLISLVAIIQSCMPSSITLSIIGRNYETKNQDFVNQCIFFTHLISIITIPIFLGLYGKLIH